MPETETPPYIGQPEAGAEARQAAQPAGSHRPRFAARVGRWAAELATVFVGVYAAFLFNNYQMHRQQVERREQILAWLEQKVTEELADVKEGRENKQKQADRFYGSLQAGEMPPVKAITFVSDYDPSDTASLLSSGGFDLLDIQTIHEMQDAESTLRQMLSSIRHDQQLSDTYILPHLGEDRSVFYDLASKELRPGYEWYTKFFDSVLEGYGKLQPKLEKLLAQVRAERRRNR
jgi:hypothetical protein